MKTTIKVALGVILTLFLSQSPALSWEDISWDEIREAHVVIMPEQCLHHEIALCATGTAMENCLYLAELFDISNPDWYVVDAIPQGWRMDDANREWRRKPADEIKVSIARRYVPELVGAYIMVMERWERDRKSLHPPTTRSLIELVFRVTGRHFNNSTELRKWVEEAKKNEAGVLDEKGCNAAWCAVTSDQDASVTQATEGVKVAAEEESGESGR